MIELAGCIILRDNKLFVLYKKKYSWYEMPGGKIEPGETPEQTAVRELKEEIDCDITIIRPLGVNEFEQQGKHYKYHWFLASIGEQEPRIMEPEIFDHYTWVSLEKYKDYKWSANGTKFCEDYATKKILL
jgi:8-oxo-dGTP diphosphatase